MAQPELMDFKPYILKRLKNSGSIDDIILHVCEGTGASWQSVSDYVNLLSIEHKDDIVVSQSPLLTGLAVMSFLLGVGMIANILYEIFTIYMVNSEDIIYFVRVEMRHIVTALVVGPAMIIGSIKGMQSVWESIFKKIGIL